MRRSRARVMLHSIPGLHPLGTQSILPPPPPRPGCDHGNRLPASADVPGRAPSAPVGNSWDSSALCCRPSASVREAGRERGACTHLCHRRRRQRRRTAPHSRGCETSALLIVGDQGLLAFPLKDRVSVPLGSRQKTTSQQEKQSNCDETGGGVSCTRSPASEAAVGSCLPTVTQL